MTTYDVKIVFMLEIRTLTFVDILFEVKPENVEHDGRQGVTRGRRIVPSLVQLKLSGL
jgi:hypothetical protein